LAGLACRAKIPRDPMGLVAINVVS
jgi:hypothetical protein